MMSLEEKIKSLEIENKILKQKNNRLEKDMKNAKIISRERDILANKMKKEKEKRLEYFNIFLEYCGEIIIAVDRNKQLIYSSEIYKKRLEKENLEINNKDLFEILTIISDREKAKKVVNLCDEVFENGQEKHEYLKILNKNREEEHIILNISPARDEKGRVNQLVIVFNDVTEIYKMKEVAEKAAKAKTSFLANTSHEIRTPMNAIVGMTELILRENINDSVKEHAYNIKSASNNLLGIINDILDISKIESGKFNIIEDSYEVASIINDITNIANVRIDEKDIKFLVKVNPNIPYRMYGDEVRLRQIIINLVNNAIKFTEKGLVKLEIKEASRGENKIFLKVSVEDTGIGIKEEHIDKLFESFEQVDVEKNKKIEGTGLGLAICKSLLKLMGGSIKITSTYGVGSKFEFILPQKIIDSKPFVQVPLKYLNQNILVFEKDKEYLNNIRDEFNELKIMADFVSDIEILKKQINKKKYDHIFVTTEIIPKIKNHEILINNKDIKITVMTGSRESYKLIENARVVQKPVYCLPIATILNNENIENIYNFNIKDVRNEFIAPKAKILIVDDNMVNLKVAKGLMKDYKMEIDLANSGYEALEMIKTKRYNIIFMDHMMPGIDGIETTKEIRKREREKNIIIALTANAVMGAKEMFLENGIDDFLSKPIEIKKLNHILKQWLPSKLQEKVTNKNLENLKEELGEEKENLGEIDEKSREFKKGLREIKEKPEKIKLESREELEKIEGLNNEKIINKIFTREEYRELLEIFLLEGYRKIKEISKFQENDIKRYRIEVHGIKSSAKSIGADKISDMAKKLEENSIEKNLNYIRENTAEFLREYEKLLNEIKLCLESKKEIKVSKKENKEEVKKDIKRIIQYIEEFNSEKTIEMIEKLLSLNIEEKIEDVLKKALEAIKMYEYDEAIDIMNQLEM